MNKNLVLTKFKKFTWHNLLANSEDEIRYLRENFNFASAHLTDCTTPPSRPKIEFNDNYIFVVLLFPVYNRKTGLISAREIDVFLSSDSIVTVHTNEVPALRDLPEKLLAQPELHFKYQNASALALFLGLLEELLISLYPMLNHVAWDTDTLESQLFTGHEREIIHRILATKKNIVDIRKSMQGYRNVVAEIAHHYHDYFGPIKLESNFTELMNRSDDIWDQLENHKSTIDAVQQTNESLISFSLSGIMKTLTVFSVIIFPLTLLATIFSMKVEGGMPFIDSSFGFWKVIFLLVILTTVMLYYFKKHRWL
ncbi:MAG: CorA family divalent cation transporter [Candidatus Komeilibacteria bacterium]|nr:CorA family divalent cation transporter [Candidatus Komeilibacteria bacterium]